MDVRKICILGNSELLRTARGVIEEKKNISDGIELMLMETSYDSLRPVVESALEAGCQAFIASMYNAAQIRRLFSVALTEIQVTTEDFVSRLVAAKSKGSSIALFAHQLQKRPNIQLIERLMGQTVDFVPYEDISDLQEKISRSSAEVIVGPSTACRVAKELGKQGLLICPNPLAIEAAILACRASLERRERAKREQEVYRNIIHYDADGIMLVDESGMITLYNPSAASITGMPRSFAKGHNYRDVFPQIRAGAHCFADSDCISVTRSFPGGSATVCSRKISLNGSYVGTLVRLSRKDSANAQKPAETQEGASEHSPPFSKLVYASDVMDSLVKRAKRCGHTDLPCLIIGEAGSGRSLLANGIHELYATRDMAPVFVDCSVLNEENAMTHMFGYEALSDGSVKHGLLEACTGAALILTNVSQAPRGVQSCLMQAIKEKRFFRVNGRTPVNFKAKVLTIATPGQAQELNNSLTQGLYYALTPTVLKVPALRDRPEDIPVLFLHFVKMFLPFQKSAFKLTKSVSSVLMSYSWPGNVSELASVAHRFVQEIDDGGYGYACDLSKHSSLVASIGEQALFDDILSKYGPIDNKKTQNFRDAAGELKRVLAYNNTVLAEKLGMSRTTLWRLLSEGQKHL